MNVIAIMKLNSDGAVTVQHIPADSILKEKDAEIAVLKDALNEIRELAIDSQGEWASVKFEHIPDDMEIFREIEQAVDAALLLGDNASAETK